MVPSPAVPCDGSSVPEGHRAANSFAGWEHRLRTWHVLHRVRAAWGADTIPGLDRLGDHRFLTGVVDTGVFHRLAADGCDLERSRIDGVIRVIDHLRAYPELAGPVADFAHPIWERLAERVVPWDAMHRRIETLAPAFGLRVGCSDLDRMLYLAGLLPEDVLAGMDEHETLDLVLDHEEFASLDGLELLYALQLHAAQNGHQPQARHLQGTLRRAAQSLAIRHAYHAEAAETLELLVEERLSHPAVREPLTDHERESVALLPTGTRAQAKPSTSEGTDRRRRRQRDLFVRRIRHQIRHSEFDVVRENDLRQWGAENFELLAAYCDYAEWMVWFENDAYQDGGNSCPPVPTVPLEMPLQLLRRRRRPHIAEEQWQHWADRQPYDYIDIRPTTPPLIESANAV